MDDTLSEIRFPAEWDLLSPAMSSSDTNTDTKERTKPMTAEYSKPSAPASGTNRSAIDIRAVKARGIKTVVENSIRSKFIPLPSCSLWELLLKLPYILH